MRRSRAMRLALALALAFIGCEPPPPLDRTPKHPLPPAPAHYAKLNESPRPMPARAVSSVTFYRTQRPDQRYIEVGEMVDVGEDETAALEKLKQSAAGIGCDGLIVGSVRPEHVASEQPTGYLATAKVRDVDISGTCIMFEQDPGTWRPPPPPPPGHEDVCAAERAKIFAAKDPKERAEIARSMPPECHHE